MVTDPDTAAVNPGAFASFDCPLYVPEGTADAYAKVEGWNVFGIKTMENRDYDARAIIEGSPDTWIVGVNGHSELNFCFTSVRTDNMDSPTTSHPTGWNSALTWPSEFFYGDNLKIQVRSDPEYFVDGIDINGEPVQFERVDENLQTYEIEHLTHDVFIAIRAAMPIIMNTIPQISTELSLLKHMATPARRSTNDMMRSFFDLVFLILSCMILLVLRVNKMTRRELEEAPVKDRNDMIIKTKSYNRNLRMA